MGSGKEIKEGLQDWLMTESVALAAMLDWAVIYRVDFRIDAADHLLFAPFVSKGAGHCRISCVIEHICELGLIKQCQC